MDLKKHDFNSRAASWKGKKLIYEALQSLSDISAAFKIGFFPNPGHIFQSFYFIKAQSGKNTKR